MLMGMEASTLDLSLTSVASAGEAPLGASGCDRLPPSGLVSLVLSCETDTVQWPSWGLTELFSSP